MEPVLKLQDVWYRYGSAHDFALKGINLTIYQGEWISILGGNGSGKSTLAKLMNGLLLPTEGNVIVYGLDTQTPENIWRIRENIGMVFQNPDNQIVAMTVIDDIAFGIENLGIPPQEINERIDRVSKQLGLTKILHQEPHNLSGGQKQRLAIAGVLAMEPKAIIFDEATSMLDPQGAYEVYQTMSALHKQGYTIIQITHEMEEILASDRVLILKQGEILQLGSPKEVLKNLSLLYEAGLIPPFAVRIREALKKQGIRLSDDLILDEELLEEVWTLSLRT